MFRIRSAGDALIAFLAAVGCAGFLLVPGLAHADAKVRVEWIKGGQVLGAQVITSTGASVASSAAPDFAGQTAQARVFGVSGAAVVSCCGTSPVGTQTNGIRLEPGQSYLFSGVLTGTRLAVIEATDPPATVGGGGGGAATIADGADIAQGALADAACGTDNGTCSLSALVKRQNQRLTTIDGKTVAPFAATATTTITRPADTVTYAVNDAWSNSTSAPTAGGYTLAGVCPAAGRVAAIVSVAIVSSADPALPLQGEVWIFDSSVTALNDNVAFALSDADAVKLVGVVPFTLATSQAGSGTNAVYSASGLNIAYACVGTTDLRYVVKVKNAYIPTSAEALTVRASVVGLN